MPSVVAGVMASPPTLRTGSAVAVAVALPAAVATGVSGATVTPSAVMRSTFLDGVASSTGATATVSTGAAVCTAAISASRCHSPMPPMRSAMRTSAAATGHALRPRWRLARASGTAPRLAPGAFGPTTS